VSISDGGSIDENLECPVSESISTTLNLSGLSEGSISFTVTQTNDSGVTSQVVRTLQKDSDSCIGTPFGTGSGTVIDPYLICTPAQFNAMYTNGAAGTYYKLSNDINFMGETIIPSATFTSKYLIGNGKILSNIDLTGDGLFASMTADSTVTDLTIDNMILRITSGPAGLIAKEMLNSSSVSFVTITNSSFIKTPTAIAMTDIGGVAGTISDTAYVTDTSVDMSIDETAVPIIARINQVGSIAGTTTSTQAFARLSASGSIIASGKVGGLFGVYKGLDLVDSDSTASLHCTSDYCGGILGFYDTTGSLSVTVTNVHFNGSIINTDVGDIDRVYGGFAGTAGNMTMSQCSTKGSITGTVDFDRVGGIVGSITAISTISSSFSDISLNSATMDSAAGIVSEFSANLTLSDVYAAGTINARTGSAGLVYSNTGGASLTLGQVMANNSVASGGSKYESYNATMVPAPTCTGGTCYVNSDYGGAGNTSIQLIALIGTSLSSSFWKNEPTIAPYPTLIWQQP